MPSGRDATLRGMTTDISALEFLPAEEASAGFEGGRASTSAITERTSRADAPGLDAYC
jgi:hypothetical protein